MFYRVVIQGRTLGGADVGEVKQHFVRVTGLSARVAEDLFGGMPQVVKRQVSQSDAERIAATLRAIGAAATVERELPGTEDETPEGILVVATPLNSGPPTVIPGMEPAAAPSAPSRYRRWLQTLRENWTRLVGGAAIVAMAILAVPFALDLVTNVRQTPAPPPPAVTKPAARAEPAVAAVELNETLLHGPWRCTDQSTGVSTYWTYGTEGAVVYHGDVLREQPAPGGTGPTGWKLDGERLSLTYPQRAADTYSVTELTLTRLRYGNERGLDIQCRRP